MSLTNGLPSMSRPVSHRSTRDRPAKAPLSVDAVVDAALTILKSDGLDAVTMRRVAAALDTGPGSLYVYVSGREGLLERMLDRVIATVPLQAPDPSRWRAQLHSLLDGVHRALVDHPGIAAVTLADPPTTEAVLLLAENMLGIQLAGGLDPQAAAWACDIFMLLAMAAAREENVRHPPGRSHDDDQDQAEELRTTFAGLPPDRFPLISAHAAEMVAGDGEERFRFAVDVVIDGVIARAARR